ncbi:MAG: VPLPA-CTERM sorting domain-containing protein [Paracoccaceae bacterium]
MNLRFFAAATCITICTATVGLAATFDYSYSFEDATVVSGSVEGKLQGDGNTVSIDSIGPLFVDGSVFIAAPLDFTDDTTGGTLNFVLDGLGLNFGWVSVFDIDAQFFIVYDSLDLISIGASIDANTDTFDSDSWIATERVSAVPLPAGSLLLLSGLAGVAALKRRKKRAA